MENKNLYPENFPTPPDELRKEKLDHILKTELIHWKLIKSPLPINPNKERTEIFRELVFEGFDHVIEFINKLKPICNLLPHHPRWENTWRTLKIYLSTWDAKHVITYKDILLARNIEIIFTNEFQNKYEYDSKGIIKSNKNEKEINQFITQLKTLIAEDKIQDVFKQIDTYYLQNDNLLTPNEFILLQSRYTNVMKQLMIGAVSINEVNPEIIRIKDGILSFLSYENFKNK